MIKEIETTVVYEKTLDASEKYKIICHEGGSRSSKTWSIFQFFLGKAINGDCLTFTIVRDKLTWIKSTLLLDLKEIIDLMELDITPEINPNRPEQVYYVNGSEIAFFGLDYAEKLHGRKQDWVWVNEAMETSKKSFEQLELRTTKGIILDYNPVNDEHWVFDLQKREDVTVIKSSMKDNSFLEQTIRDKINSYEPTPENIKRGTADNYMWQVYGLGNKARLEGVIFTNWDTVETIPEEAKFVAYGMDFGYTNDPTTLIALHTMNNELYFDEVLYAKGLTNMEIAGKLRELQVDGGERIFADSSEPKSIEEIRREGFNIHPALKGADSVRHGIDFLKSYKMHLTARSTNAESELRKYKWAEDKIGNSLNVPVDANNHCIDPMRYVSTMTLKKTTEMPVFEI